MAEPLPSYQCLSFISKMSGLGDWFFDMWSSGENSSAFINSSGEEPSNDFTLSCSARSIQGPIMLPYSTALTTTVRAILSVLYIIIFPLGIFFNALVIYLVAKYKKLRTRSFAISLQVVVLDLILLCTVFLLHPITTIANQWLYGEYTCAITGFIYTTFISARTYLMFMSVIDCFLSVFFPLFHRKWSTKVIVILSTITWLFTLMYGVIFLPGILDCYAFCNLLNLCLALGKCSKNCATLGYISIGVLYGPATLFPLILYSTVYWKAISFKRSLESNIHAGISNKGEVQKRDWRATITFFLLFVAVFAVTSPIFILSIIASALSRMKVPPPPVLYFLISIANVLNSSLVIVDPIIILRHRDIREVLREMKQKLDATELDITVKSRKMSQ